MRHRFLVAFILILLSAAVLSALPAPPATEDTILIVGVSPVAFEDGKETPIEVTVAYDLTSSDAAELSLNSNTLSAQGFSPMGRARVTRGTGTATILAKFVPRYWNASTPAKISVTLWREDDSLSGRRVLADDDVRIPVARRAHPESDPTNPNPSDAYEDTIVIKSVSPEYLVTGQETEVTVTVAYELLSREESEINLGASLGRGNGYKILSTTRLKIGKGETVITARLVPTRNGNLPFTKLFVNLSEYPHRNSWSPLAGDSHTIEVR